MRRTLLKDDSGVNIVLEYIFSITVMVILFSMMILIIGDVMDNTDRVVLREEFDIIANDIANRISSFSSELYITNGSGVDDSSAIEGRTIYFDLPELVQGKQYKVMTTYNPGTEQGYVTVTYEGNSNVYSTANFTSKIKVEQTTPFYSQQSRYSLILVTTNPTTPVIQVVNNV